MRRVLVFLALALPPSSPAQVPNSGTPDPGEIVERYIAARGGLENI